MTNPLIKTSEHWIETIANKELPAITSTARMLERFSSDDKSSLPKLSQAILHDQALSSCLLKVANNIQHIGVNKVSTVSRASVVLGIHAVKNICLTSKLVEGLLRNEDLDVGVYNQLTKLMANSFYSGLLAKMMVPQYAEDTQEEVYLAAMLYRIGETAFWATGGDDAIGVLQQSHLPKIEFEQYCTQHLGINFTELSVGLAKNWHLGDMLVKSLDNPKSRTIEMQTIFYADKLSSCIANPSGSMEDFSQLLAEIADVMKISVRQLKGKISETKEHAFKLLNSYNASLLKQHINDLPNVDDFNRAPVQSATAGVTKDKLILATFKELSQMTKGGHDFNAFLLCTLTNLAKIFSFDRCSFLMLTNQEQQVKCRFSYNNQGEKDHYSVLINLRQSENIVAHVMKTDTAALINNAQAPQWQNYITREIAEFMNEGALCCAPVSIGSKAIGVICGQLFTKAVKINEEDYSQFCFLIEHLNMCLTMVARK